MKNYIHIIQEFHTIASGNDHAVAFAVMEIKSVYEDSGNPQGAIKEFETLLTATNNKTVRNVIRFQLLELQKNNGQRDKAIENLRLVLQENG